MQWFDQNTGSLNPADCKFGKLNEKVINPSILQFVDRGLARLLLHIQQYRSLFEETDEKSEEEIVVNLRLPEDFPRSSANYVSYMQDLSAYHRLNARFILHSSDRLQRFQKAEFELKSTLQLNPESAESWCLMGMLRCLQMDTKAASECFEMAMQLETWPIQNHRLYRLKLAQCYADLEVVGYRKHIFNWLV